MFTEKTDICNFTDDNTLYKSDLSLSVVLHCLENDITVALKWFRVNSLKAYPQKFQFMVLGSKKVSNINAKSRTPIFFSQNKVDLLGITINYKLI